VIKRYMNTNWDAWTHHLPIPYGCLSKPMTVNQPGAFVYVTMCIGWNPTGIASIQNATQAEVGLSLPELRVLRHR
jgi:TRAP-type C4-dicarboxylate transport system permease small subunit